MPTVTGTIRGPVSTELAIGTVIFHLVGDGGAALDTAFDTTTGQAIEGISQATLTNGVYSLVVPSNDVLLPAGTRWARSHGKRRVLLHVTETPATQNEDDILAEAPGTLESAALAAHAADTGLHAGYELAYTEVSETADFSVSSATPTLITGSSTLIVVPSQPFVVRYMGTMRVNTSGDTGQITAFIDGNAIAYGASGDNFTASAASQSRQVMGMVRIPNAYYAPAAGTTITFDVRLSRPSGTGSVDILTSDNGVFGQYALQIQAVTV